MKCVVVCYLFIIGGRGLSLSFRLCSSVEARLSTQTLKTFIYLRKITKWKITFSSANLGFSFFLLPEKKYGFGKLYIWKEFKQFCWIF